MQSRICYRFRAWTPRAAMTHLQRIHGTRNASREPKEQTI